MATAWHRTRFVRSCRRIFSSRLGRRRTVALSFGLSAELNYWRHRAAPGDILAVSGTSLFARAISWLTRSPISHVGLVVGSEPPLVMEALWRVKTRPLWVSLGGTRAAYLLKPVQLSATARSRIVVRACHFSAQGYGLLKLFLQFLDALAARLTNNRRVTFFTDHFGWLSGKPICSYEVGEAYKADGLNFGVPARSVTPADIWNFALSHKGTYQIVRLK